MIRSSISHRVRYGPFLCNNSEEAVWHRYTAQRLAGGGSEWRECQVNLKCCVHILYRLPYNNSVSVHV